MSEDLTDLTRKVIGAAIAVHKELGPGLLESAYENCLAMELAANALKFERQMTLPLRYRGRIVGRGYRIDFLVAKQVIIEVKSVERFEAVHTAQLLSYLRLSGCKVGLLMNFNVRWLVNEGIKRIINGFD